MQNHSKDSHHSVQQLLELIGNQGLIRLFHMKQKQASEWDSNLQYLYFILELNQLSHVLHRSGQNEELNICTGILDELLDIFVVLSQGSADAELVNDLIYGLESFIAKRFSFELDLGQIRQMLEQGLTSSPESQGQTALDKADLIQLDQDFLLLYLHDLIELAEFRHLQALQDILVALSEQVQVSELCCSSVDNDALRLSLLACFTGEQLEQSVYFLFESIANLQIEPLFLDDEKTDLAQLIMIECDSANQSISEETPLDIEELPIDDSPEDEVAYLLQLNHQMCGEAFLQILDSLENNNRVLSVNADLIDDFQTAVSKLSNVSEIAGYNGLKLSSALIVDNLESMKKSAVEGWSDQIELLSDWYNLTEGYLLHPEESDYSQKLVLLHCSQDWLNPIEEAKAVELNDQFQQTVVQNEDLDDHQRLANASEEDVSIQFPDDVYPDLLESLLQEMPELTMQLSQAIENLMHGGQIEDLMDAQRAAHTLKGGGNTVGIKGIANISHYLEDILIEFSTASLLPGPIVLKTLVRAVDCLEEMSDALSQQGSAPVDSLQVLQEVLDLVVTIDNEGIESYKFDQDNNVAHVTQQDEAIEPLLDQDDHQSEPHKEETEPLVRVPVSVLDKLLQFSNEMMIANGRLNQQLKQAMDKNRLMQHQFDLIYELGLELEEIVDIKNLELYKEKSRLDNYSDFDSLEMEQYNELHSCTHKIHEAATDMKQLGTNFKQELNEIDNLLVEQSQLNDASQRDILFLRMVSVQSMLPRFQRCVRQAGRMTGKKVMLDIEGQETLMDRDILSQIVEPIMHLLRNAISHGIEQATDRENSGKPETGSIRLIFKRSGNLIFIECIDDGQGLNYEAIRQKALKQGLITEDSLVSENELKELVFQPNFSTSHKVTQVSGRGIGMDAVMEKVRSLGGKMELDSCYGKGCHLMIELPQSLAHYHALLIKIGQNRLALAERSIERIIHPDEGEMFERENVWFFKESDNEYPVKAIESVITGLQPDLNIPHARKTVIIVKQSHEKFAVLVEEIIGVKELVVKSLGEFMPKLQGIIGASILEDGSIASVLDLQELLEQPGRWSNLELTTVENQPKQNDLPSVLVVDDSLSARRSLEQFVSDMGFNVLSARDGQEAIDMLYKSSPDLVVTDLEMPRVNGIELTEFIRNNQTTVNLPVVMITSRSTNKHKSLAEKKVLIPI